MKKIKVYSNEGKELTLKLQNGVVMNKDRVLGREEDTIFTPSIVSFYPYNEYSTYTRI